MNLANLCGVWRSNEKPGEWEQGGRGRPDLTKLEDFRRIGWNGDRLEVEREGEREGGNQQAVPIRDHLVTCPTFAPPPGATWSSMEKNKVESDDGAKCGAHKPVTY